MVTTAGSRSTPPHLPIAYATEASVIRSFAGLSIHA
jgi:hypothetical protein